jgi:hypothetical protein
MHFIIEIPGNILDVETVKNLEQRVLNVYSYLYCELNPQKIGSSSIQNRCFCIQISGDDDYTLLQRHPGFVF